MKIRLQQTTAFSLVEVTLALGIMAFSMVTLFGLLPLGINSNQSAVEQTTAAQIASALIADVRQTPTSSSATPSPRFLITVPALTSDTLIHTLFLTQDGAVADANASTAPPTSAQDKSADPSQSPYYRATMVFTPPSSGNRTATGVRLLVTWPALADSTGGTLPVNFSGSFETMAALDRN